MLIDIVKRLLLHSHRQDAFGLDLFDYFNAVFNRRLDARNESPIGPRCSRAHDGEIIWKPGCSPYFYVSQNRSELGGAGRPHTPRYMLQASPQSSESVFAPLNTCNG